MLGNKVINYVFNHNNLIQKQSKVEQDFYIHVSQVGTTTTTIMIYDLWIF